MGHRAAVIAHENKKPDLAEWALFNREFLADHELVATGTTGMVLEEKLRLEVVRVRSGALGGDQQIGAMIAEGRVDLLVFFADPLQPMPHDPDVKALLRLPWSGTSRSPATELRRASSCRPA